LPQSADPASLEHFIRNNHHNLIDHYVKTHFDFLASLGLSPADVGLIKEICRCHRKTDLRQQEGAVRWMGALLRVIDELDISPNRAPVSVLRNAAHEMDSTSCWHWFKHNIVEPWRPGHTVIASRQDGQIRLEFQLIVRPPSSKSILYWLNQIRRPLHRVLFDEGAAHEISSKWRFAIRVEPREDRSAANPLGPEWERIEQIVLSAGRKVILVIDDEVRKMEDLLLPLMDSYHVIFSPNAKDALTKLEAASVDLAVVDIQVGSGNLWTPEETAQYKMTGLKLFEEVRKRFPATKIGILTGTRHDINLPRELASPSFFLRKPVDPDQFERKVCDALG